jgi:hypothetical protein
MVFFGGEGGLGVLLEVFVDGANGVRVEGVVGREEAGQRGSRGCFLKLHDYGC